MIALRFFVAALAAAVLASCATTAPRHTGNPPVLAKLEAMGIDSRTYAKIANHRILDFGDILGLLKKGVPSPVILTYIQSTHAPYTLTDDQLNQLMNAGASADLVNYLGNPSASLRPRSAARPAGRASGRLIRSLPIRITWVSGRSRTPGRMSGTTRTGSQASFSLCRS